MDSIARNKLSRQYCSFDTIGDVFQREEENGMLIQEECQQIDLCILLEYGHLKAVIIEKTKREMERILISGTKNKD